MAALRSFAHLQYHLHLPFYCPATVDNEKQKEIEESTQQTKAILNARLTASQPKNLPTQSQDSKFIKYKPSQQSAACNPLEKIIRVVEMPIDPLDPPKFKHKRVPTANGSPPVPVTHSPPRPVTIQDQQDWKIPSCISNRKNPKGYTVPLDKRLAADGRGLQEVQINDNFAKLSEALYVGEQKAREEVEMMSKVQKEMMMKEKERKEQKLRALAQNRRFQRRLEAKDAAMRKKSKITIDGNRDLSEKVALGMATTGAGHGGEVLYDRRLFNQEKGMDSGFATDDKYNVYDRDLFTAQPTLSTLYRPKKDGDNEMYCGANEQLEKVRKTGRFKPDKRFTGTREKAGVRDRPVEFEKVAEEADPFGLGSLLTEVQERTH